MNISTSCSESLNINVTGKSMVSGKTQFKQDNTVVNLPFCEVHLYDQDTHSYLYTTKSDHESNYCFNNLNTMDKRFFVVLHHPTNAMNGSIADNIGREDVDN